MISPKPFTDDVDGAYYLGMIPTKVHQVTAGELQLHTVFSCGILSVHRPSFSHIPSRMTIISDMVNLNNQFIANY